MSSRAYSILFYGVAYDHCWWDMKPIPPWYDPEDEDDPEASQTIKKKPVFGRDADAWYLYTIGIKKPQKGESKKVYEKKREDALAALAVAVGVFGGNQSDDQSLYICAKTSKRMAAGRDPLELSNLEGLTKDPSWDTAIEDFFKLAGLPFDKKRVGWWLVAGEF
jgi:hypothetical protein